MTPTPSIKHRRPGPAPVLFACLFAVQASFLAVTPILPALARDLGVSTAVVGQLRAFSGAAGAAAAIATVLAADRLRIRRLLDGGLVLLASGSVASALAPGFAALALAQLALGAGMALTLAGAIAAAAEWSTPKQRVRVLSWTLLGQPAAWVAGMPLVGLVGRTSWRLVWLVPLAAAGLALVALRALRPGAAPPARLVSPRRATAVWRRREVVGWALGELMAFSAWSGTLVYSGALLIESYGLSVATAALLLTAASGAYFPGTLWARRFVAHHARVLLVALGAAAAVGVSVLMEARGGPAVTTAVLAGLMPIAGTRTLAGSAFGLDAAPDARVAITGVRATATQLGYLLGPAVGGAALAVAGWPGLAAVLSLAFALSTVPHLVPAGRHAACPAAC